MPTQILETQAISALACVATQGCVSAAWHPPEVIAPARACAFSQIRVSLSKHTLFVRADLINQHLRSKELVSDWYCQFFYLNDFNGEVSERLKVIAIEILDDLGVLIAL